MTYLINQLNKIFEDNIQQDEVVLKLEYILTIGKNIELVNLSSHINHSFLLEYS